MWVFWLLLFLAVLFLLRSEWEKKRLSVSSYEVFSSKLPTAFEGMRIVFLTDLHGASFGEHNADLIRKVGELSPDLILLGGDMITLPRGGKRPERVRRDLRILEDLLPGLKGIAPVMYADGNHERRFFDEEPLYADEKEAFLSLLDRFGVPFLLDRSEDFVRDASYIRISGLSLDDGYYERFKKTPFKPSLINEKLGRAPACFQVLLLHSPLYLSETAAYGADLVLSGHFHGGTIRLPILGGVMTPQYQFFNPFCKGQFSEERTDMIVSGGLGTHTIRIRFNDLPDIVRITLYRRENEH